MKKYIFIIALILSLASSAVFAQEENNPVVPNEDVIFQSSVTDIMHTFNDMSSFGMEGALNYNEPKRYENFDSMPLFKQLRIRATNKYRRSVAKSKSESGSSRQWFWMKKNKNESSDTDNIDQAVEDKSDLMSTIDNVANIETSDTVSLEGSVNEEQVEKQLQLDASNITYDDKTGEMVATGRPVLFLPSQQTKVIADVMTYDDQGNILKANGNVVVIKDGNKTFTDYLEVNMNEETIDADNITADFSSLNLAANHAMQKDGLLIFDKGKLYSDNSSIHRLSSMIGPNLDDMILDEGAKSLFFGTPERAIDIKVSTLEINAKKNHDVIKAKDIKIGHNGKYFFKWPSLTVYTNKERDYFEANNFEFGSQRKLGMYIGPGFAFSGPFSSVIKIVPYVNYRNKFGIGGLVKYVNTNNKTFVSYGTSTENFILNGRQKLDDDLYLQYGYNSYMNEWFHGGRMPKYIAELVYNKTFPHRDFLGKNMDMTFAHRASFGFMKDDDTNTNSEKFNNDRNFSTTRTKYMAQIQQTLYRYENIDKRVRVMAGLTLQGAASLYGNGDTQFVASAGPNLRVQYKNWIQDASYYITGYQDHTPMPHYDAYRYGSSSFRLVEALRINRYITVAWQTHINIANDSPNGKHFQENAFLVSLGPDDLKLVLGYDFTRERTYFGVNVAFNPKGTTVTYDKMIIKNPERLGKKENPEDPVEFLPAVDAGENEKGLMSFRKSPVNKGVLQYAQVIELEDPDKERID